MKNSKRKLLLTIICMSTLMILSSIASLTSSAYAEEVTVQQKALTVLNDVVGLDLAEYATTPKGFAPDTYFDVLSQETVDYSLVSDGSKLKLLFTFTDGALHIIQVREREGSPLLTKSAANVLEMAKDFLGNYENYSGKTFYGELKLMLNTVEIGKNSTIASGNTKLTVNSTQEYTTFRWIYTHNDVESAYKCVALSYANGFLKYFIDTWDLYNLGSKVVNLSKDEAVTIAMDRAKSFSWTMGSGNESVEVKDLKVTKAMVTQLVFCSSLHADNPRSDDLLELYPMWRIGVGLDTFYPGNVYGIYVDIWADTKEIRHVQAAFTTLNPELIGWQLFDESTTLASDNEKQLDMLSVALIATSFSAILGLGTSSVLLHKKKSSPWSDWLPKLHFVKVGGVLLCLLVSSAMLLPLISAANATSPDSCATIWGCTAEKDSYPGEVSQQQSTASTIYGYFDDNNYYPINYQGSNTQHDYILDLIDDTEQDYPRSARVYFDHGIGSNYSFGQGPEWHYEVKDSLYDVEITWRGNVTDYEIYDLIEEKSFFALINTCLSARIQQGYIEGHPIGYPTAQGMSPSGTAVGMPFAWTNRTAVYRDAEGFDTALNMSYNGYSKPDGGKFCYIGFYLGSASLSQWVDPDYTTTYYYEWLEEFFDYALDNDVTVINALDYASEQCFNSDFDETDLCNGFSAVWPPEDPWGDCQMNVYGNGNLRLYQYSFTINAGQSLTANVYVDNHYMGTTGNTYHVPSGSHTIQVSVPTGYEFANFTWTGGSSTSNPMTLNVSSNMNVTAYYDELDEYSLTVLAYNQYEQEGFVPLDIDYEYVGTTGYSYDVEEGSHAIEVESPLWDYPYVHVFDRYEYDSTTDYDNPMTLSVTDDMTVTAYYITYLP